MFLALDGRPDVFPRSVDARNGPVVDAVPHGDVHRRCKPPLLLSQGRFRAHYLLVHERARLEHVVRQPDATLPVIPHPGRVGVRLRFGLDAAELFNLDTSFFHGVAKICKCKNTTMRVRCSVKSVCSFPMSATLVPWVPRTRPAHLFYTLVHSHR